MDAKTYGVVGYGVVGRHMAADIERAGLPCRVYDVIPNGNRRLATRAEINACDCVFVCVGTPMGADGRADLGAIDEVFSWLRVPMAVIRSTVPPGTARHIQDDLIDLDNGDYHVAFIPEFIGEGVNAPYNAMRQPPFLIIGADLDAQPVVGDALSRLYNSECEFIFLSLVEAELAKYAENYFLALKVSWANELYDIAEWVGADFRAVMNAVTHDYRIGRSHTHVYPDNRGWSGRCLPKDLNALRAHVGAEQTPLLEALIRVNDRHRGKVLA